MAIDPADPGDATLAFLAERHLATLTTLRPDGSPHVVAVGFTYEAERGIVRVICSGASRKARNVSEQPGSRAVVCQVDRGRWLSLEGTALVATGPEEIADAERRYTDRYQAPRDRPDRVAIEIMVDRILGRP